MKKSIILLLIIGILSSISVCYAAKHEPNLVAVDGGMGTVIYADKNTVEVLEYNPPYYTIKINYIRADYNYNPPKFKNIGTIIVRYNWDEKNKIEYKINSKDWAEWDVTKSHDHASGNPLIPLSAETAFMTAYNMKFFGDSLCQPPNRSVSKDYLDKFYREELGVY
ncbi:MAG: hypothetical protein U0K23_10240 [Selenomonadaceae bacterium]|nr:hypothetical protein [Selenomonadaceae bacterium]